MRSHRDPDSHSELPSPSHGHRLRLGLGIKVQVSSWTYTASVTVAVILAIISVLPSSCPSPIMVVRYACMGCVHGPTYFTTYHSAAVHLARSPACNQSQRGIATVVLPNRPTDIDAGGSGAAGVWSGRPQVGARRRARPSSAGCCDICAYIIQIKGKMHIIYYIIISFIVAKQMLNHYMLTIIS